MSIIESLFKGLKAYSQSVRILFSRKFICFLIFPLLLIALLSWGVHNTIASLGGIVVEYMESNVFAILNGVSWLGWLSGVIEWLVRILFMLVSFWIFLTIGGNIILILMSPVFSFLSERVEAFLTGKKYPFSIKRFLKEVGRGISISLRNMFLQLLLLFLLFFCTFLPVIGIFTPVAMFFVSAYFYGFSFMDYTLERRYRGMRESVRYINGNKGLVLGVGLLFTLCLLVPFIKILVCAFVSLLSVIAGTIVVIQAEENKRLN